VELGDNRQKMPLDNFVQRPGALFERWNAAQRDVTGAFRRSAERLKGEALRRLNF
jgi:hypothetical protein